MLCSPVKSVLMPTPADVVIVMYDVVLLVDVLTCAVLSDLRTMGTGERMQFEAVRLCQSVCYTVLFGGHPLTDAHGIGIKLSVM